MSVAVTDPTSLDPTDLTAAVSALRDGDGDRAARLLEPFFVGLADDPEVADIHARVCSLLAQARLLAGDPVGAQVPLRQALRAVPREDRHAQDALRALQGDVFAALARQRADEQAAATRARLVATPIDALLTGADTASERATRLVDKALAELEAGMDPAPLLRRAIPEADASGEPRPRVLARLALARCPSGEPRTLIRQAWDIADAANEPALAGIVARDAGERGVPLPRIDGPLGVRETECG